MLYTADTSLGGRLNSQATPGVTTWVVILGGAWGRKLSQATTQNSRGGGEVEIKKHTEQSVA